MFWTSESVRSRIKNWLFFTYLPIFHLLSLPIPSMTVQYWSKASGLVRPATASLPAIMSTFYRLSPFTLDLAQIWILVNAIFESNGALVRKKETKRNEIPKNDIQKLHEEFLKLFENYDKRIRPGLGAPLPVTVNMLVQSISKLDQVDMRYEMGVFLRQEWTDSRLDFRAGYI